MKKWIVCSIFCVVALGLSFSASAQFTATTITAIQDGSGGFTAGTSTAPEDGDALEITGIVTATRSDSVYIQDAQATYSGIRVYAAGEDISSIQIGDEVTAQGYYVEYYGESEIHLGPTGANFTIDSTGNTVYDPITVAGSDLYMDTAIDTTPPEQYEGVLIKINNITVTNDNAGSGEMVGSSDGTDIKLDNEFISLTGIFELDGEYNVVGISLYTWNQYKIAPRTALDVSPLAADATPPTLIGASVGDYTTVQAIFSEVMGATGLTTASNYSVSGLGTASAVSADAGGDSVTLTVPTMSAGVAYTLTCTGLYDLGGNPISTTGNSVGFQITIPDVTINEVMYDSLTGGLLDVEWVELHNTTTSPMDISDWVLSDGEGELVMPSSTVIPATGYLVVSATGAVGIPGAEVISASGSFKLSNTGDNLALFNDSAVLIDGSTSVTYPALASSNAGVSIEKIVEDFPYSGSASAWRAATVRAGFNPAEYDRASPGRMNNTSLQQTNVHEWADYR